MIIKALRRIQTCGFLLLVAVLGAAQSNVGTPASPAMSALGSK
jgi:hypothetical protein